MPQGRDARERGMALVVTLWGAAILAIVTMSVLELTRADSRVERGGADAAQLGAIADAAINISILAMLGPSGTRPPVTGTPFPVGFADYQVRMSIQDETGKPDLNWASPTVLRLMLGAAGLDPAQAEAVATRIVARRSAGPDGQPPRPFQAISDLLAVPGMTVQAYRWISPCVTVYAQTPYLDPTYASVRVLSVFQAQNQGAADRLRQIRAEAGGLRDSSPPPGVVPGHAYTITAEVTGVRSARAFRHAVIRLTGQPGSPLLVYEWN